MPKINDNLILICGESNTGKSACLRDIPKPEGVLYLNCEASKKLPFNSKFKEFVITNPLQVYEGFTYAETLPECHTIVIDSLTFLMEMYESTKVLTSDNTMSAWQDYQQFFKNLMQQYVACSTKNVIFTAHTVTVYDEAKMAMSISIPVKGALRQVGLESYFSCIVGTSKHSIDELDNYKSDLLTINEEEEILGFKYVFQTKLTKETVNSRIRSPMGMWNTKETFIDNSIQNVLDRLHSFYK